MQPMTMKPVSCRNFSQVPWRFFLLSMSSHFDAGFLALSGSTQREGEPKMTMRTITIFGCAGPARLHARCKTGSPHEKGTPSGETLNGNSYKNMRRSALKVGYSELFTKYEKCKVQKGGYCTKLPSTSPTPLNLYFNGIDWKFLFLRW